MFEFSAENILKIIKVSQKFCENLFDLKKRIQRRNIFFKNIPCVLYNGLGSLFRKIQEVPLLNFIQVVFKCLDFFCDS